MTMMDFAIGVVVNFAMFVPLELLARFAYRRMGRRP